LLPLAPALERAIAVAACGGHHLLLLGPRGTGKSHALEWLIALQPPLEHQTALENRLVSELAPPRGRLTENRGAGSGLSDERSRPVRRVGIQAKAPALIGSATARGILPGEFSRAHGGVLIADEFPEWARDAREALREPLERGRVTLTRVQGAEELPAGFVFAANGNLCPCGGWPRDSAPTAITQKDATLRPRVCRCSEPARQSYLERISGPILDRIDLVVRVNAELPMARSQKGKRAETKERPTVPEESALTELRDRVLQARERLLRTWGELPGRLNGSRAEELLERHPHWRPLLETPPLASLRSRHKRLRVALSLAAWDGKTLPEKAHFLEAALLRPESAGLGF
jgi:magnesium chelatase family protein